MIWFFFIILIVILILISLSPFQPSHPGNKKPHRLKAAMGFKKTISQLKPQPPRGTSAARQATVAGSNS
jgi:hypothetical protein